MRQSVTGFELVRVRDIGSLTENDAFPVAVPGAIPLEACSGLSVHFEQQKLEGGKKSKPSSNHIQGMVAITSLE
jgi:hypothetical protein